MIRRGHLIVVAAAVAVLEGACASKKEERANLPMACETTKCICTEADRFVWQVGKEVPVEWKLTGEAFCPEGYVLRLDKK